MRLTLFATAFLSLSFLAFTSAEADHALPFNPSHYPHEIQIKTVDLTSAKKLLSNDSLHAYIGGDPFINGAVPQHLGYTESLGSYLVATFDVTSTSWKERRKRCAAACLSRPRRARKAIFSIPTRSLLTTRIISSTSTLPSR